MAEDKKIHGCKCRNCSIELITQSKSADTYCRFCGTPALTAQDYEGVTMPESVIPFEISKAQARQNFTRYLSKRPLAFSAFSQKAKSGNFAALYIPVCLSDIQMQTRIISDSGNVNVTSRAENICTSAGKNTDSLLYSLISPYNFEKLTSYTEEHADIPFENPITIEDDRLEELEIQAINEAKASLNKDGHIKITSCEHTVTNSRQRYALVPVWVLSHNHKGYTQQIFMNGQNGKIIGNPPPSIARMAAIFGIIAAGCTVLGEIIYMAVNGL